MSGLKIINSLALLLLMTSIGCSFHYDQGLDLENEGRFEEASIEYHRAYVDDPNDLEIKYCWFFLNLS